MGCFQIKPGHAWAEASQASFAGRLHGERGGHARRSSEDWFADDIERLETEHELQTRFHKRADEGHRRGDRQSTLAAAFACGRPPGLPEETGLLRFVNATDAEGRDAPPDATAMNSTGLGRRSGARARRAASGWSRRYRDARFVLEARFPPGSMRTHRGDARGTAIQQRPRYDHGQIVGREGNRRPELSENAPSWREPPRAVPR